MKIVRIQRDYLFASEQRGLFPKKHYVLLSGRPKAADVDIIIGTYRQAKQVNLLIENYLNMEQSLRTHIWVVEGSRDPINFSRISSHPQVTKVMQLSQPIITKPHSGVNIWASYAAGYAAQIGHFLGKSPYVFFSHSDMMACKEGFLTYLMSKMTTRHVLAAFTQREAMPFTGGMLYRRSDFDAFGVDWLPKTNNPYVQHIFDYIPRQLSVVNWIDAGEEFVYKSLSVGRRVHVCASRGVTGDFWGHPLTRNQLNNEDLRMAGLNIEFGDLNLTRHDFAEQHPLLTNASNEMWRKCFTDAGELIFIHRGRGTTGRNKDRRGNFQAFLQDYMDQYFGGHPVEPGIKTPNQLN